MNIIKKLEQTIKDRKEHGWGTSSMQADTSARFDQILIMEALIVLLDKATECKTCNGTGKMEEVVSDRRWDGGVLLTKTIPCGACKGTGKTQ